MMFNMRRFLVVLTIMTLTLSTIACSRVEPGYTGIKVDLLGGDKGVHVEELGVGRYWIGVNEELYLMPTFTQNYVWTQDEKEGSPNDESITFQTSEGMDVGADVGISYAIIPQKGSELFQKYRRGIEEITDLFLRNMTRDAFVREASKRSIQDIYGPGKSEFIDDVQNAVSEQVKDLLNIEKIYLIGKLRLPESVVTALNSKMAATQKAEQRLNEVATSKAEADKVIETARGDSESQRINAEGSAAAILVKAEAEARAMQLRADVLTKNPQLIDYERVRQWNGVLPKVTGAGATMFNLGGLTK